MYVFSSQGSENKEIPAMTNKEQKETLIMPLDMKITAS